MNQMINKCPVCGGELTVTRLHCRRCDITIEGQFTPAQNPFGALSTEQMQFVFNFVRCEGRLNRMEEVMGLSYPTLRNRLVDIIRTLGYEPGREEQPVRLTADERKKILEDLDQGVITWAEAQRRLSGKKDEA